jgi:hypothetical protein
LAVPSQIPRLPKSATEVESENIKTAVRDVLGEVFFGTSVPGRTIEELHNKFVDIVSEALHQVIDDRLVIDEDEAF